MTGERELGSPHHDRALSPRFSHEAEPAVESDEDPNPAASVISVEEHRDRRPEPSQEIEYVEVLVPETEERVEEKIVPVEVVSVVEEIRYVPRIVEYEKIIEVPVIEYKEVLVERVVEVPEVVEQVVVKEIAVPQYVEIDDPIFVELEKEVTVRRRIPTAVESIQTIDFHLPKIKLEYEEIHVPCYVPMFVEIPVPVEQMCEETRAEAEAIAREITMATSTQLPSLAVLEELASRVNNFRPDLTTDHRNLREQWQNIGLSGSRHTAPRPCENSDASPDLLQDHQLKSVDLV